MFDTYKTPTMFLKQKNRLPWQDLFQPVIKLCRDGFVMDDHTGKLISCSSLLLKFRILHLNVTTLAVFCEY